MPVENRFGEFRKPLYRMCHSYNHELSLSQANKEVHTRVTDLCKKIQNWSNFERATAMAHRNKMRLVWAVFLLITFWQGKFHFLFLCTLTLQNMTAVLRCAINFHDIS